MTTPTQTNGHRGMANYGPAYYPTRSNILATATLQSLIAHQFLVGVKDRLFKGSLPDPLPLREGLAPRDYLPITAYEVVPKSLGQKDFGHTQAVGYKGLHRLLYHHVHPLCAVTTISTSDTKLDWYEFRQSENMH